MSAITKEIKARMKEFDAIDATVAKAIADEFGVSERAVIASAVRDKDITYKRKERVSKSGDPVISKADLVAELADAVGIDVDELDGLDKATKTALSALLSAVG